MSVIKFHKVGWVCPKCKLYNSIDVAENWKELIGEFQAPCQTVGCEIVVSIPKDSHVEYALEKKTTKVYSK